MDACGAVAADLDHGSHSESFAAFIGQRIGLHRLARLASDGDRSDADDIVSKGLRCGDGGGEGRVDVGCGYRRGHG